MGDRGIYASGNNVAYKYETVDLFEGVKILKGIKCTGLHDLA